MKIAGRDAGHLAVVIDILTPTTVMIDGDVRRRKCNIKHLEPLPRKLDIKKNEPTENIRKLLGLFMLKKKTEKKVKGERPKKQKKQRVTEKQPKKEEKKIEKLQKNG